MPTTTTVTLLFADLVGSTELLERLGDEAGDEARRPYRELLRGAIATRGGEQIKRIGDGVMAVFTSAVEAAACAVEMQQAVARTNQQHGVEGLALRVGLNVGDATLEGRDYFGLPVVLAHRLCEAATGGQILVSDIVRSLVGTRAPTPFRALPPHDLKGIGPTAVYELPWEARAVPRIPLAAALAAAGQPPFVGRERELDALLEAWREARAGSCSVVLVSGEPGIGKTRLVAELARAVADDGVVLYGRCDEDLGVPYQPFSEAFRTYAEAVPDNELASRAGPNAGQLVRLVPTLGTRLAVAVPAPRGDAEADRYVLFESVVDLLSRLAEDAPVLLVLDDLHWAAKPTLLLLRHIARSARPTRMLVVGPFRDSEVDAGPALPELLADLRRAESVKRVSLSGLTADAVIQVVASAVGGSIQQAEQLGRTLHANTSGNPFFVSEMLRHLDELGGGRVAEEFATFEPPPSVREMVASRLARLSGSANRVLTAAAVVGAVFPTVLLEAVLGKEDASDTLLDALDEASRARLVLELSEPAGHYTFVHALVRQVLTHNLSRARQARLHRRVGEALEELPAVEGTGAQLAHHFIESAALDGGERAVVHAVAAASDALGRLAYEEAVTILERTLRALEHAGAGPERTLAVLLLLSEAHNYSGDVAGMQAAAQAAADAARDVGDGIALARAALLYGRWVVVGAPDPVVAALCHDALRALPADDVEWRARVVTCLANYEINGEGRGVAAADLAAEGLALARRSGAADAVAAALYSRAVSVASEPGEERLALAEELVAHGRHSDEPRVRLEGLVLRAAVRLELADLAGFQADMQELRELAEANRWWAARFWVRRFEILTAMMEGRFQDAEAAIEALLAASAQDSNGLSTYAAQVVALRFEQGRLGELEPLIASMVEQNPGLVAFQAGHAVALAATGAHDRAATIVRALTDDFCHPVSRDQNWVASLALLAEAACQVGVEDAAPALFDCLRPFAGRLVVGGGGVVCFGAVDRYLGMTATAGAAEWFEAALRAEDGAGMRPAVARTRMWYGRLLSEIGDEAAARAHFDAARATAVALGMDGVAAWADR